jgi:hypothetical protein
MPVEKAQRGKILSAAFRGDAVLNHVSLLRLEDAVLNCVGGLP